VLATRFLGSAGQELCDEANVGWIDLSGNARLVVPNDHGVFEGAADFGGIRCVHPVQIYVDLKGHPERSAEAAEDLRARLLDGNANDN